MISTAGASAAVATSLPPTLTTSSVPTAVLASHVRRASVAQHMSSVLPASSSAAALVQRLNATTEQTYLLMARVAEQLGEKERTLRIYSLLLAKNAYSLPTLLQCAQLHRHAEQFDQAIHYFTAALQIDANNGEAHAALGHCFLMMDELTKAYNHYQLALQHLQNPKDPKLWYGIGILYDRYGSYDHAEEAFSAAIRMDPAFDKINEIYFRLGIIYKQTSRGDVALQCFRYIIQNPPKPLNELDIHFQIGHCHEQMKEYHLAKDAYEHVLSVDPKHAKVLQQAGWLYHTPNTDFHNEELAVQLLEKSIESDPNDAQTWYLLGRCHMTHKRYNQAHDAYQQAVYRDPKNPTFWCSIGVLYFQIRQYRDALEAYSRAIRLNPYLSEVWFDLGTLYESCNNQLHDALDAYDRAAGIDPTNTHIQERLRIVKEVMGRGGTTTQGLSNGAYPEEIQNSMSLGSHTIVGPSSSSLLQSRGTVPTSTPAEPTSLSSQQQRSILAQGSSTYSSMQPSPHLAQIQTGSLTSSIMTSGHPLATPAQRGHYSDQNLSPKSTGLTPMQVDKSRIQVSYSSSMPHEPSTSTSIPVSTTSSYSLSMGAPSLPLPSSSTVQPLSSSQMTTQPVPTHAQPSTYFQSRGSTSSHTQQQMISPPGAPYQAQSSPIVSHNGHYSSAASRSPAPHAPASPYTRPQANSYGNVSNNARSHLEGSLQIERDSDRTRVLPAPSTLTHTRAQDKQIDSNNHLGILSQASAIGSNNLSTQNDNSNAVDNIDSANIENKNSWDTTVGANIIHYTSATAARRPSELLQQRGVDEGKDLEKNRPYTYRRRQLDDDYDNAGDEDDRPSMTDNNDTKSRNHIYQRSNEQDESEVQHHDLSRLHRPRSNHSSRTIEVHDITVKLEENEHDSSKPASPKGKKTRESGDGDQYRAHASSSEKHGHKYRGVVDDVPDRKRGGDSLNKDSTKRLRSDDMTSITTRASTRKEHGSTSRRVVDDHPREV